MADPRNETGPQDRRHKQSALMSAISKASSGERVNFCPFGCTDEELDDLGYCRHLVGFANDKKMMEPMILVPGTDRRVVRVKKVRGDDGKERPILEPVLKTDKFEQITVSYRVYRDVDSSKDQKIAK